MERITRNDQLLSAFVNSERQVSVNNLEIIGNKLVNYSTILAEKHGNKFIVNRTKYSVTTRKIQNKLASLIPDNLMIEVTGIRQGYSGTLTEYVK